jgi:hypothetical protein
MTRTGTARVLSAKNWERQDPNWMHQSRYEGERLVNALCKRYGDCPLRFGHGTVENAERPALVGRVPPVATDCEQTCLTVTHLEKTLPARSNSC